MRFGAQIRQAGGLLAALRRAEAMGAEVMQVFAQSPRQWRIPEAAAERAHAFRQAWTASDTVREVVCHAPYLLNLASADPVVYGRSRQALAANLRASAEMGATGLIVHLGSHLGAGLEACLPAITSALRHALDAAPGPIIVENTAGGGGTVGRSFDELARILDAAGGDPRLRICLDTQHLWASGVVFRTPRKADQVVRDFHRIVGIDRLACLHLNDSKVALGAGADRHENLGRGAIGEAGLRAILGQPRLQHLPAVLEVSGIEGDNKGTGAADLALARRLHADGLAERSGAAAVSGSKQARR